MKKILYTALAASLFAFSSCDDILDTSKKSSMEKTEVFSNEALVNDVVMGLHQSFGETNSYRGRYIAYFGVNSDCEIWNNTGKKGAFTDKEGALVTYNAANNAILARNPLVKVWLTRSVDLVKLFSLGQPT